MKDPELPNWNWFYLNFPWIGGAAAIALLILLSCTNFLRADQSRPRWRDYTWLSWMGLVAYLSHNIEEYGVDLFGRLHQFPKDIVRLMELPPYPDCSIPPLYFVAVNVTMFWIAAPLASLLSRRHPLVGLSIYSIIMVNAVVHIIPSVAGTGYGAGTLTAAVVFIPLSIWMIRACFGPGRMSYAALALLVAAGMLAHAVLMVPMLLFLKGIIGSTSLVLLQVVNPFLLMFILWLGERWRGGSLLQHLPHADEGA